jgi:hypothetical protein
MAVVKFASLRRKMHLRPNIEAKEVRSQKFAANFS